MRSAAAGLAITLGGCAGNQSALDSAGPQARRIEGLYWGYLGVSLAVYAAVALSITFALIRRGSRRRMPPVTSPPEKQERWLRRGVGGCIALTVAVLFLLLVGDFSAGRAIRRMERENDLAIKVIGHQWWWEVQYQDPVPSQAFTTADEIHIPVGRTVRLELISNDVIHSFWVPNLHGKRDLIPGHPTRTSLRADRAGTYLGQCAEFCGFQHAFMRLAVVAESEEAFHKWVDGQRREAPQPSNERLKRGQRAFLSNTCVMCHTVQGTTAQSRVGPDLTHLASRPLIGGVMPFTRGNLAGWIIDPQRVKPGIRMPMNPIRPDDLDYLLDYLESLK